MIYMFYSCKIADAASFIQNVRKHINKNPNKVNIMLKKSFKGSYFPQF